MLILLLLLGILIAILFPQFMKGIVILALLFVGYVVFKMNTDVPSELNRTAFTSQPNGMDRTNR